MSGTFVLSFSYHDVFFYKTFLMPFSQVGVLYRVDELYHTMLVCRWDDTTVLWIPYAFYVAVFDAFETLLLYQSEYHVPRGISGFHSFLVVASWMFLALMGASVPNDFECDRLSEDEGAYSASFFFFPLFKL
jgi:hypothetical protein